MKFQPGQKVYVIWDKGTIREFTFRRYDKHMGRKWCEIQYRNQKGKFVSFPWMWDDVYPTLKDAQQAELLWKLS